MYFKSYLQFSHDSDFDFEKYFDSINHEPHF